MHSDITDSIRCPNKRHEEGWLVVSADNVIERQIIDGTVGCPSCMEEWRIVSGELLFTKDILPEYAESNSKDAPSEEDVFRLAAMLNIDSAAGSVVLAGEWARYCDGLSRMTGVRTVAVNSTVSQLVGIGGIRVQHALPLGTSVLRGVALDVAHSKPSWINSAVHSLVKEGRILAPLCSVLPPDIELLAQDENNWIGRAMLNSSGLVPLMPKRQL